MNKEGGLEAFQKLTNGNDILKEVAIDNSDDDDES